MSFEAFIRIAQENQAKNDNKIKKIGNVLKFKKIEAAKERRAIEEANKVTKIFPKTLSVEATKKRTDKDLADDCGVNKEKKRIADNATSNENVSNQESSKRSRPTSLMDALEQIKAESNGHGYVPKEHSFVKVPKIPRMCPRSDSTTSSKSPQNATESGFNHTPHHRPTSSRSGTIPLPSNYSRSDKIASREFDAQKREDSSDRVSRSSKGTRNHTITSTNVCTSTSIKKNSNPELSESIKKSSRHFLNKHSQLNSAHSQHKTAKASQQLIDQKTKTHKRHIQASVSSKPSLSKSNGSGITTQLPPRPLSQYPFADSSKIPSKPSGIAAQLASLNHSRTPVCTKSNELQPKATKTGRQPVAHGGAKTTTVRQPAKPDVLVQQTTMAHAQKAKLLMPPVKRSLTEKPMPSGSGIAVQQKASLQLSRGIAAHQQSNLLPRGMTPLHPSLQLRRGIAAQQSSLPPARGIAAQLGGLAVRRGSLGDDVASWNGSEEDEDDYASDDSFIDDTDVTSAKEYVKAVKEIHNSLKFDPSKYAKVSKYDDLRTMEASYRQIQKEESVRYVNVGDNFFLNLLLFSLALSLALHGSYNLAFICFNAVLWVETPLNVLRTFVLSPEKGACAAFD